RFLTAPQELSELGIDATALPSATNGLVSIADLPGGAFSYDEASQTIEIRCSPSALRMTRVRSRDPGEAAELTPSSTGAVLNYAFLASSVLHGAGGPRVTGGGGIVDGRVFGAF